MHLTSAMWTLRKYTNVANVATSLIVIARSSIIYSFQCVKTIAALVTEWKVYVLIVKM